MYQRNLEEWPELTRGVSDVDVCVGSAEKSVKNFHVTIGSCLVETVKIDVNK